MQQGPGPVICVISTFCIWKLEEASAPYLLLLTSIRAKAIRYRRSHRFALLVLQRGRFHRHSLNLYPRHKRMSGP
jgi:hypothetical protein